MNWFWISTATYLTTGCLCVVVSWSTCWDDESLALWNRVKKLFQESSRIRQAMMILAMLSASIFLAVVFPVIFAGSFFFVYREQKVLRKLSRQHREVILQPIAFGHMHPTARSYITQHEDAIDAAGFQFVDSFLYKPEPFLIQNRCYLSEDGLSILSIGHIDGDAYYSLTSILSNGAGVETSASCHPMDHGHFDATGQFYSQMYNLDEGKEVAEMVARHHVLLDRLRKATGQTVTVIHSKQVPKALSYVNRKFSAMIYDLGEHDAPPPTPVWPLRAETFSEFAAI